MNWQNIHSVTELAASLKGKRVFLRLDLNVPQHDDGSISDDTRIRASLPTLQLLIKHGAKIAVASHLGRPKGGKNPKYSLRPVAARLGELLQQPVTFVDDCIGPTVSQAVQALPTGGVVLLENTRFYAAEELNQDDFAAALAEGFDAYINDAFGTLHRAHASTAGMAKHFSVKGMGLLVAREVEALRPLLNQPTPPYVLILGGAKVADKIGILRNLLPRLADSKKPGRILIGGGMAFTFLKAQGVAIGASLLDESKLPLVEEILLAAQRLGVELVLPNDYRIALSDGSAKIVDQLGAGDKGLDIGPKSVEKFAQALRGAATVFWNGPLGMFEKEAFMPGTLGVAKAVAELQAHTVIGGGDTLAAFTELGLQDRLTHASTGGGATLEFLEGRDLPGLQALSV